MHLQIRNIAALDLCNATANSWVNRVESLLDLGVDLNARFGGSESPLPDLADAAAPGVKAKQPPQSACNATKMPALRRASLDDDGTEILGTCDLTKTARLIINLLKRGANLYALFR